MAMTPEKRAKMENLIYNFFSAFDKTNTNTNYYKDFFGTMSDAKFDQYFSEFFENPKAHLILNIKDYENTIKMEDIERAAKVLKIPLFENVYMPHITMDNDKVICTKEPVPVGYLTIKRTQQTLNMYFKLMGFLNSFNCWKLSLGY
jgi:hypothetical protein